MSDHSKIEWTDATLNSHSGDLTTKKVGKKAAGRLLDGVEHGGMPARAGR